MATPRQLGRRASVAVLATTATAVAMLVVLVAQTSRHASDSSRIAAAGRQRLLCERVVLGAIGARQSAADDRARWQASYASAVQEWQASGARLTPATTAAADSLSPTARGLVRASALRDEVIAAAARVVAPRSSVAARDSLGSAQRRYLATLEDAVSRMAQESEDGLDGLVQLEVACVVLLLAAIGLAVRLALYPAQEQLAATVSALAESESRTRAMLDSMNEGMLLTDAEGRMLVVNPSAREALGIGEDEGATIQGFAGRLIDTTGAPLPLDALPSRRAIVTGRPVADLVLGVRSAAGAVRWLAVNAHPLHRGSDGVPYAAVSVFRDVSAERQLEEERAVQAEAQELQNQELLGQAEALERGQALFRSVVETVGNAIVGLGLDGHVFEWNREAELLFGVPRADALGQPYVEHFVPAKHRDRMRASISDVFAGQSLRNQTAPVRGVNGTRRTVIWNITPLRVGAGGQVHGLIAAGLDITEREASDERFRVLFERSSDAHLLMDDSGVIDCNDATLRLLQYDSKSQVVGRQAADLSPRRQPDGRLSIVVGAQMRQMARDRGYHRFEWVHRRSDGGEFPVEVTLTPVRLNGREVILSVWHDIAERKAVEAALRAAKDAAESANRTKSDFMTRMNHELRTPLTAIIGFSKVLLQGRQGALTDGAQRYADRIHANGLHLLSLINQILDVAKVEAGRMELEPERIAVGAIVRDTIHMLEATADAKGIGLRAELPEGMQPVVTDAGKLRQILINLVGNAIKFTDLGEVCVRVEADPRDGRPVSITVRDTGIGIPLDRQQKVFEPFEQGDSSTRRQFGGTGLGLSIVKAFAELIGAAIEVESTPGEGTAFTVWLAPTDLELK